MNVMQLVDQSSDLQIPHEYGGMSVSFIFTEINTFDF